MEYADDVAIIVGSVTELKVSSKLVEKKMQSVLDPTQC